MHRIYILLLFIVLFFTYCSKNTPETKKTEDKPHNHQHKGEHKHHEHGGHDHNRHHEHHQDQDMHSDHQKHSFKDVKKYVKMFESPSRLKWQKPDEVIKEMNLKNGDVVADIGAGTGYFSRRIAKAVGPNGKVHAYDIEPNMVNHMKEDANKLGLKNYLPEVISADKPKFPENQFNVIFIANTYHHIPDRINYFKNLIKSLKKGGRLIIVDFKKMVTKFGPPKKHKIAKSQVTKELWKAGYEAKRSPNVMPYHYFIEFQSK